MRRFWLLAALMTGPAEGALLGSLAAKPPLPVEVRPLGETRARVTVSNARLRFVVLDFGLNPTPVSGVRLSVVREDKIVGEVKVSGPAQGSRIVADVIRGEAAKGDTVIAAAKEEADR